MSLAKRIIPCLDVKDGQTVKGTNFVDLRYAGNPVELGKAYSDQNADELVFLDITASYEGRKTFTDMVSRVAAELSIPFTVGGGINEMKDVDTMLNAGADKVSINSAALRNPSLVDEIANHFGSMPSRKMTGSGSATSMEDACRLAAISMSGPKRWRVAAPARYSSRAWTTTE